MKKTEEIHRNPQNNRHPPSERIFSEKLSDLSTVF